MDGGGRRMVVNTQASVGSRKSLQARWSNFAYKNRRVLLWGLAVVAVAAIPVLLWLVIVAPPLFIDATGLSAEQRLKAENDLRGSLLTALAGIIAAYAALPTTWLAIRRWLQPPDIQVSLDAVVFWPPDPAREMMPNDYLITAQLRFYNQGATPESLGEITAFWLDLFQGETSWHYDAYAVLEPMKKTKDRPEFGIWPTEFPHSLVVKREQQVVLNTLFVHGGESKFDPGLANLVFCFQVAAQSGDHMRDLSFAKVYKMDANTQQMMKRDKPVGLLQWMLKDTDCPNAAGPG